MPAATRARGSSKPAQKQQQNRPAAEKSQTFDSDESPQPPAKGGFIGGAKRPRSPFLSKRKKQPRVVKPTAAELSVFDPPNDSQNTKQKYHRKGQKRKDNQHYEDQVSKGITPSSPGPVQPAAKKARGAPASSANRAANSALESILKDRKVFCLLPWPTSGPKPASLTSLKQHIHNVVQELGGKPIKKWRSPNNHKKT